METIMLPLVNWGLGTLLIGVFAVVCIVLIAIIYNMTQNKTGNAEAEKPYEKDQFPTSK